MSHKQPLKRHVQKKNNRRVALGGMRFYEAKRLKPAKLSMPLARQNALLAIEEAIAALNRAVSYLRTRDPSGSRHD